MATCPGSNKDDARAKWGEEQVHIWRRSTISRLRRRKPARYRRAVWPYISRRFLPRVLAGQKVLVARHGNSLRSLVMVLDRLSKEQILGSLATGVTMVYSSSGLNGRVQGSARGHVSGH